MRRKILNHIPLQDGRLTKDFLILTYASVILFRDYFGVSGNEIFKADTKPFVVKAL